MKGELIHLEGKKFGITYIYNKEIDLTTKVKIMDKTKNESTEYWFDVLQNDRIGIVIIKKNSEIINIKLWDIEKNDYPIFTLIHQAIQDFRNSEKYIFPSLIALDFHLYDVSKDEIADKIAETLFKFK